MEDLEEIGGDAGGFDDLGFGCDGEGWGFLASVCADGGEGAGGGLHFKETCGRGAAGDADELVGVRVRKWLEKDGLDDGEHGGVAADGEGESEDGGGGEGGLFTEDAEGVASVLTDEGEMGELAH